MYISAETLDDALLELYPALLARSANSVTASRGETAEVIGALIEIKNPRARLSRSETRGKLYSSLGELLWYLSKDNRLDFIVQYVSRYADETEDGLTISLRPRARRTARRRARPLVGRRSGAYFTPASRLFFMYSSLSASLTWKIWVSAA
jgi:hypothetical protein